MQITNIRETSERICLLLNLSGSNPAAPQCRGEVCSRILMDQTMINDDRGGDKCNVLLIRTGRDGLVNDGYRFNDLFPEVPRNIQALT